jgi:hypothetical protein
MIPHLNCDAPFAVDIAADTMVFFVPKFVFALSSRPKSIKSSVVAGYAFKFINRFPHCTVLE